MKMLVLGGGLQGSACAFDLLETTESLVTIADRGARELPRYLRECRGDRLRVVELDARDEAAALAVMKGHAAVMSALPYYLNYPMARAAVQAGCHFSDLGGNTQIVQQQQTLDGDASATGVSVVPDCGLAPGMVNILAAEAICRLDQVEAVKLYVGGLPRHPEPPLNYQVVYSLEGALDYYTTPSWVLRDGRTVPVDPMTDLEIVAFPKPVGELEAFHTGGGLSTMPWQFEGRVRTMEYKTLRYPGHAEIMRAIRDLGLLGLDPVDVAGTAVKPRELFIRVVDSKLRRPESDDLVALRVVAQGTKQGEPATVIFQLLDYCDARNGVSAMMRTTGYSLSITAQMQVDGRIEQTGVRPAYQATPFRPYVEELAKRGVEIVEVDGVRGEP